MASLAHRSLSVPLEVTRRSVVKVILDGVRSASCAPRNSVCVRSPIRFSREGAQYPPLQRPLHAFLDADYCLSRGLRLSVTLVGHEASFSSVCVRPRHRNGGP